jgi:Asp-tRNA(Asn)/Glu-tRNA(Gln) amidotransferase C subunit
MTIDQLKAQQLQLLAKKALLADETAQIDKALGQIGAILQFTEAQPAPEASAAE